MHPRARRAFAALSLLAGLAACAPAPTPPPAPAPPAPPPPALAPPPSLPCERILWLELRKSERRLEAACEGGGRAAFRVALGRDPVGPKQASGDHRTPEGLYHLAGPARRSRFHRFLPIDYPSLADAERARREGRLAAGDYARIAAAHRRSAPPPADAPLGGDLGFHGEGARWRGDSEDLDWTYGCVAMKDEDLDFLAARAAVGTPVRILP